MRGLFYAVFWTSPSGPVRARAAGGCKNPLASRGPELASARAGQTQVPGFRGHFLLLAKMTDVSQFSAVVFTSDTSLKTETAWCMTTFLLVTLWRSALDCTILDSKSTILRLLTCSPKKGMNSSHRKRSHEICLYDRQATRVRVQRASALNDIGNSRRAEFFFCPLAFYLTPSFD